MPSRSLVRGCFGISFSGYWACKRLRCACAAEEADSSAGHLAQLCIIGSSCWYGESPAIQLLDLRNERGTLQSAPWLIRSLITWMS